MADRAIFLDRDDTLIKDTGYLNHPDQVRLIEGVAKSLVELKNMGYKLIVVTNQSAVARGIITEKVLDDIHQRLQTLLSAKGAQLDGIYYCPYHPDGVIPKYRSESDERKPNPGMILRAAKEMDIDLSSSWLIGNSDRDIEAGQRAGCRTILIIKRSRLIQIRIKGPQPDFQAVNMKEAINIIKKHRRLAARSPVKRAAAVEVSKTEERLEKPVRKKITRRRPVVTEEVTAEQRPSTEQKPSAEQRPSNKTGSQANPEQLLDGVLRELKTMQRTERYGEFSLARLIAGVLQIVVVFCLLISIWLLMEPNRNNELILITLGFAAVIQLMTLSFYIMRERK